MQTTETKLDVLAVFSHPDDAELSVAGTLLSLKTLGYRTGVLDMTRGEMGTRGTPELRAQEALDAAAILKLDARLNLEQPDGHVWPTEAARVALVRVIRACQPKVILTSHWDDPHPDHADTCRIVREAARLASMRRYDEEAGQDAVNVPAFGPLCLLKARAAFVRRGRVGFRGREDEFYPRARLAVLPSRRGRTRDAYQRQRIFCNRSNGGCVITVR